MAGQHYNANLCAGAMCAECCGCEQYEKGKNDALDKIRYIKAQYVDSCNICIKINCDNCLIEQFIKDLEVTIENISQI